MLGTQCAGRPQASISAPATVPLKCPAWYDCLQHIGMGVRRLPSAVWCAGGSVSGQKPSCQRT